MAVLKIKKDGKWIPVGVGAQGEQGIQGEQGKVGATFTYDENTKTLTINTEV